MKVNQYRDYKEGICEYIRITPEGVDGSGPLYERVAAIADDWLKEHGLA
jgi:hypothetical protein